VWFELLVGLLPTFEASGEIFPLQQDPPNAIYGAREMKALRLLRIDVGDWIFWWSGVVRIQSRGVFRSRRAYLRDRLGGLVHDRADRFMKNRWCVCTNRVLNRIHSIALYTSRPVLTAR
jgi:hypothetical protein